MYRDAVPDQCLQKAEHAVGNKRQVVKISLVRVGSGKRTSPAGNYMLLSNKN
jgi:hypothetical protein